MIMRRVAMCCKFQFQLRLMNFRKTCLVFVTVKVLCGLGSNKIDKMQNSTRFAA